MLWKRVLTAVVGIPLFVSLLYEGRYLFLVGMVVLTTVLLSELRQMLCRADLVPPSLFFYGGGLAYLLISYFAPSGKEGELLWIGLTLILLLHLLLFLVLFPKTDLAQLSASFLGSCYVGLLLSFFILLRKSEPLGFQEALLVLVATWAYDTGAYFAGCFCGRHFLLPHVSPNKTVEGVLGGLVSTCLVTLVFSAFFLPRSGIWAVVFGVLVGISVQLGDLVESALKRVSKVKDSGSLLPGHGGFFDRFDGFLWSCPTAYFFFKFFG
ncbi:MAG: Phosphatidate cytidylyltransferase [Thermoanaerobacterales bacterium 50_218]|nr:MAG: Phosphatidate cytidylyltransferase [Thermoanaerobacterales bacterium 50_218]HAA90278.1 hypothetical protein [Peptococcaceae bacterium]